ncbi:DUF5995 family protein [Terrabacter sp. GCM10028922]|uniref:DUF5995 family protein n=1 Tax=Terrabacter sp. GCM10028922 TaxID=3273428 RepID=UPI00361D9837
MGWFTDLVTVVRQRLGDRTEPVPAGQPASIEELLERMRAVGDTLPDGDGVRAFHEMYVRVTELVRDRVVEGHFSDPRFMIRLDVVFAGLYLEAVAAPRPAHAWSPVLDSRRTPGILSIQFALAGMNAHINHDLPVALVRACRQLGTDLDAPGVEADYRRITGILESVQEQVRRSFFDGVHLELDRWAAPVSNLVASWSIGRAREAAWTNARVLWELDGVEPLRTEFLDRLDRSVGLGGRFLLTPVGVAQG